MTIVLELQLKIITRKAFMKNKFTISFPQKSIFGFKILSSVQSSIACYFLLFFGKVLNNFFGLSKVQIISATLFNLLLNSSLIILIVNLFIKRKQIKFLYFFLLNIPLFIYVPIALYEIIINILRLLIFIFLLN